MALQGAQGSLDAPPVATGLRGLQQRLQLHRELAGLLTHLPRAAVGGIQGRQGVPHALVHPLVTPAGGLGDPFQGGALAELHCRGVAYRGIVVIQRHVAQQGLAAHLLQRLAAQFGLLALFQHAFEPVLVGQFLQELPTRRQRGAVFLLAGQQVGQMLFGVTAVGITAGPGAQRLHLPEIAQAPQGEAADDGIGIVFCHLPENGLRIIGQGLDGLAAHGGLGVFPPGGEQSGKHGRFSTSLDETSLGPL